MDLEKICQKVITIAKTTGTFIAGERVNFDLSSVELKGKANFVSYVDKKAEGMIVEQLRKLLPESGFITEEGTASNSGEQYRWVIDPLDGTTNFIHGTPPYAVSIGLIEGEEIVLGVVYEITRNECFYAWKGSKAMLNGKEIHVSEASTTGEALIATGFPYGEIKNTDKFIESINFFMANSHGIRRMGSAATDLSYVAAGRFEAFWEKGLSPWDVAAGALILQQAGGKATDFRGKSNFLFSGEIVAANSHYFSEFQTIIENIYCR
ncbi:MAG: inositol monophosphatase [Bacteroidetes bacterium]|nr:inositol monophosphatase [Bacteroidota bacterium]MCL6101858.1 inositol monophosphatase [Bacteroidota bacterium]